MPPAVAISSYEAVSPVCGGRLVNGLSFKEFTFDLTIVLSPSHMKSSQHCGSLRTHVGRPASNSGRLCTNSPQRAPAEEEPRCASSSRESGVLLACDQGGGALDPA